MSGGSRAPSAPSGASDSHGGDPTERREGEVLEGRYRLVSRLGRGGFGDVWRAEELLPDGAPFREVALKLLAPHVADAAAWVEEAKLLASFRHPSLVTIYATGVFAGAWPQPFVAMELLEGENLSELLTRDGPVPWRRVLAWAREAAAALDVIHVHGVVHLDLKPANLFLSRDGTVKVLDFGIARRAAPDPRRSGAAHPGKRRPAKDKEADQAAIARPPPSSAAALSKREVEMATAAFVAEHHVPVAPGQTPQAIAEDAFAPTFVAPPGATPSPEGGSATRAIIGTPGFMAPEIFEQAEPSAATDAYALAMCMVQLATGRFALDVPDEPETGWSDATGVTAWWSAIRTATMKGDLRDLRRDPAKLPPGLLKLLLRLLAVDPAQRKLDPGKLREALDEAWDRPFGVPEVPFPGRAPMDAAWQGLLFGRDEETARLGRDLEHEPCVVLVGPEASGKTSLALAGLVPFLGRRAADDKDDWVAVRLNDPKRGDAALDDALAQIAAELRGASFDAIAAHADAARVGIAILVDPLEDLAAAPVQDRARIGEILSATEEGQVSPGLRVIGVLDDAKSGEVSATAFGAALRASMRYVGPPAASAARHIVNEPLVLAGVDPTGLAPILSDVQREMAAPGRLPFVATALAELFAARERSATGKITIPPARWKDLRGVVGAAARAADLALAELPASDRHAADEVLFCFHLTSGSGRWDEKELLDALGEPAEASKRMLSFLLEKHILRRDRGQIALVHEGLLDGWKHLATLRTTQLDRILFVERLREAAQAWEASARSADLLIRGAFLKEIEAQRAWLDRGPVSRDRELVAESSRAAARRRATRVVLAVLAVLSIIGLVWRSRVYAEDQARAAAEAAAAEKRAYVAELVARSRRTEDPYARVALIAEAMNQGSEDGLLPVELAESATRLPAADFLTMERVVAPALDWDDRWIVAGLTGTTLLVGDLRPPDAGVVEDIDIDADLEKVKRFATPHTLTFQPHADPIAERVAFAFDAAFATRSATGEVRVWRMRDDGTVALAAIAPMKCVGVMRTAARVPVLACATETGVGRWDIRATGAAALRVHKWKGEVADVSPDGKWVIASAEKRLVFWNADEDRAAETTRAQNVVLVAVSPRDPIAAVVGTSSVEILELASPEHVLFLRDHGGIHATARWDDNGLDLGLCDRNGRGKWIYLRQGGRAPGDPPPAGSACGRAPGPHVPQRVWRSEDIGMYADLNLDSRAIEGWMLPDGRLVTRDLVVLRAPKAAAETLLAFRARDKEGREEVLDGHGVAAVVRDERRIAWEVGAEVRVYDVASGRREATRPGHLLRRCADGRIAAWAKDDKRYRIFDAKSDATIGEVPVAERLVLGVDGACTTFYTQALDGVIHASALQGGASRPIATADGYVYDVEISERGGPGLLLSLSSGAIARIDERAHEVRLLGYATPRAGAITDGPEPGEYLFSDATGAQILRANGAIERITEASGASAITDLALAPDRRTLLLLTTERVTMLDLRKGERRWMKMRDRERILPWDAEGSVLFWTSDRNGPAEGPIVARAPALASLIAKKVSNLRVEGGALVPKQ